MPRKLEFDRDAALAAASQVFWEHGYEASSIERLTTQLGIGRASLYHSFSDKRSLLTQVVDRYQDDAREVLAQYLASREPGRATIVRMFTQFATPASEGPQGCMCLNLGLELGAHDPELRAQVIQGIERLTDTLFALIRRGQADGSIDPGLDAKATSQALSASVLSLQALKRLGAPAAQLKGVAQVQISLIPAPPP